MPIADIFKRRFNAALKLPHVSSSIQEREKFDISKKVLFQVVKRASEVDPDFLLGINNFDVRNTFNLLKPVLQNGTYLQKNSGMHSHFQIDSISDFIISEASVIKAITLGEGRVYYPGRSAIKNILANSRKEHSDLIGPYIFHLLFQGSDVEIESLAEDSYNGDDFIKSILRLFDQDEDYQKDVIATRFKEYADAKLMEVDYDHSLTEQPVRQIRILPRGAVIWNDLRKRSFLLELFRDDIYLPTSSEDKAVWELIFKSSAQMSATDRLGCALRMIHSYIGKEGSLIDRQIAAGGLAFYVDKVGGKLFSSRLENGFAESVVRMEQSGIKVDMSRISASWDIVKKALEVQETKIR